MLEQIETLLITVGSVFGGISVLDLILTVGKLISNKKLYKKLDSLQKTDFSKVDKHLENVDKRIDKVEDIYKETHALNSRIKLTEEAQEKVNQAIKHLTKNEKTK